MQCRLASGASVHLRQEARVSGEFDGLVQGVEACGNRELPLARSATHLGLMARAAGNAALRAARNGRMRDGKNGAQVCALGRGAPRRLRGCFIVSRHNYGTPVFAAKTARIASIRKIKDFLVAREALR